MTDLSHLDALNLRLSHERARLVASKTKSERQLRVVWVAGIEREIASEMAFLGISEPVDDCTMTDEELLAALGA